ncbi:hypothetical protein KFL_005790050 [Klebsormidium nitens]|uniref:EGF-like domain-containing protein n=1 Tax=Klebsormidium nitens TaxID=105231 RepID=A0A1Y1IGD4_KLENI|nr:hypothetical protein KFL_005790050 [Klebsormidium nitens]|eukprot:GAQ89934.1 hypothetical protein KFL_005790050 [Klebsormidium nitens]
MAPTCLLVVALALLCVSPFSVSAQEYTNALAADYTCPPGFIPIQRGTSDLVECDADQCYNEVVGCGPGNVCVQNPSGSIAGYSYQHICVCNPPYYRGDYQSTKGIGNHISCFIPGRDPCSPNPCENGGTCSVQFGNRLGPIPEGENSNQVIDFTCACPFGFLGKTCALSVPNGQYPTPVKKSSPPPSGFQGVCGFTSAAAFPVRCYFNNDPQGRYVCCDAAGCDGFNPPDNLFPHCKANGYVPPGFGVGTSPSTPPATSPPSGPLPSGSEGVCGSGDAAFFPTRCWFNSDPQGRYVCCDGQGCDGFNADNLTPHCKNYGYVPPNFGVGASPPSPEPPSGSQGVCGTGAAASFPLRCWYNNDPLGRYICCDSAGCDGFVPPDSFFPRCKSGTYLTPNL